VVNAAAKPSWQGASALLCGPKWPTHDTEIGRLPPLHKPTHPSQAGHLVHGRTRLVAQLRVPPHRAEAHRMPCISSGSHANSGAGMLPRRDSRSSQRRLHPLGRERRVAQPHAGELARSHCRSRARPAASPSGLPRSAGCRSGSTSTCIAGTSFMARHAVVVEVRLLDRAVLDRECAR